MAKVDIDSDEYKLGQNIQKYRKAKNWSQQDLGNAVDMDRASISRYESGSNGEMGFKLLIRFANVLDVSPDRILNFDSELEIQEYDLLNAASRKIVDPVIHMALQQQMK